MLNRTAQYSHAADDYSTVGCFPKFPRRGGENSQAAAAGKNAMKVKKYSLDNEIPHNNNSLASRGLKGSFSFDEESGAMNHNVGPTEKSRNKKRLQKSWDQLAEGISSAFNEQLRLNSKSSDDIYSSQWDTNDILTDFNGISASHNTDSGDYLIRDDHSSKSSQLDDSMSSETGNFESEFSKWGSRIMGRLSSRGGSGRKSSVTFVKGSNNELNVDPVLPNDSIPALHYIDIPQGAEVTTSKASSRHRLKSSLSRIFFINKSKGQKSTSSKANKRLKSKDSFRRMRELSSDMSEKLLPPDSYDTVYGGSDAASGNKFGRKQS